MSADYRELVEFQRRMKQLTESDKEAFIKEAANELAGRLLRKVVKRTPKGEYPHRVGGTLQKGWTIQPIRKEGNNYIIEVINPTEYASYVEYGHRTANHKGWVQGKFMMTISEKEINRITPRVLEAKLNKWLSEALK